MQGWHAKKYANKVGMMHESKGQHIGKAPSLHLFHTTFRQRMEVFLKHCLEMRLKPCHVFLQHYHKSVLTVALLLHASGTNTKTCLVGEMRVGDLRVGKMRIYPTETLSLSGLQIAGHNKSVRKTQILMHSINNYMDGSRFSSQGCCLTVV